KIRNPKSKIFMKLFIVANLSKGNVATTVESWLPWLKERAAVVGIDTDASADLGGLDADVVLALGGDGTLLGAARRLHGRDIPLIGVNFGRLGFLASFTPANFQHYYADLAAGRLPISTRMMLEASLVPAQSASDCDLEDSAAVAAERTTVTTALYDAVITAGPPFHMIELEIRADGEGGGKYFGDDVIHS